MKFIKSRIIHEKDSRIFTHDQRQSVSLGAWVQVNYVLIEISTKLDKFFKNERNQEHPQWSQLHQRWLVAAILFACSAVFYNDIGIFSRSFRFHCFTNISFSATQLTASIDDCFIAFLSLECLTNHRNIHVIAVAVVVDACNFLQPIVTVSIVSVVWDGRSTVLRILMRKKKKQIVRITSIKWKFKMDELEIFFAIIKSRM